VNEDEEVVQAFLEESREQLDLLDRHLVELESQAGDEELLSQVYRAIHTIKGTCGFLGFHRLEALTHAGEDLLQALQSGGLVLDADVTTSLLGMVDAVRGTLDRIEATGEEGEQSNAAIIAALATHAGSAGAERPAAPAGAQRPASTSDPPLESGSPPAIAEPELASLGGAHESSVRVDVALLDKLMDLVGELVLARSQIGEVAGDGDEGPLVAPYRQLRRVTTELQESVMRARLQPVGIVTGKFPRIARDLASSMDKRIRVELEGEEVGVDKAVNEALRDVLLHLVRNTVDHGIESPGERVAAGKDPEGRLLIHAAHEGGRVLIKLSDDGAGIDPQRLVDRATREGILTGEEAAALDVHRALELMFLPGLSTKEEVTTVSGRGVGMDAVRANLDLVGGSIEVSSELGHGTTFRIHVPLTLAIVPIVTVWSADSRYAVPQVHVQEVVHLEPDEVTAMIDEVDGARLHRLRGRLLTLIELADQMGVSPSSTPDQGMTIVVVAIDGKRFGIVVDAVGDTTEAVAKPLTRATRTIPIFSGVTILSDGRPTLIVDLDGLADAAGLVTARDDPQEAEVPVQVDTSSLLLATGAGGRRLAVPLSTVARLEHFPRDRVQRSGDLDVVQYGESVLPLIEVAEMLPDERTQDVRSTEGDEQVQTIVCHSSTGQVGLVVQRIEDVVPEPPVPSQPSNRRGVAGRVMVDDLITELLDVEALVAAAGAGGAP